MISLRRPVGEVAIETDPADYKERIVAFIDIFGFSDLIATIEEDPSNFVWVVHALLRHRLEEVSNYDGPFPTDNLDWHFTAFSDSIVVSMPADKDNTLSMAFTCSDLAVSLLKMGFLVRGGIHVGKLFHSREVVFGQGLIDAYKTELHLARYPRIVVDQTFVGWFRSVAPGPWFGKMHELALRRDFDGLYYINILNRDWPYHDGGRANDNGWSEFLSEIRERISEKLDESSSNPNVRSKYYWFCRYFNEILLEHPADDVGEIALTE